MIKYDCKQGSPEWLQLRLGIPTASQFHRIITPKTRKPSASRRGYIAELCAEWLMQIPVSSDYSELMNRGTHLEDQARAYYEFQRDLTVERVGFVTHDTLPVGCSPDGLTPDRGLELKCPGPKQHMLNVFGDLGDEHICQVQGGLWLTGLEGWDVISFHPMINPAWAATERDEEFVVALDREVRAFCSELAEARKELLSRGFTPAENPVMDEEVRQIKRAHFDPSKDKAFWDALYRQP